MKSDLVTSGERAAAISCSWHRFRATSPFNSTPVPVTASGIPVQLPPLPGDHTVLSQAICERVDASMATMQRDHRAYQLHMLLMAGEAVP